MTEPTIATVITSSRFWWPAAAAMPAVTTMPSLGTTGKTASTAAATNRMSSNQCEAIATPSRCRAISIRSVTRPRMPSRANKAAIPPL